MITACKHSILLCFHGNASFFQETSRTFSRENNNHRLKTLSVKTQHGAFKEGKHFRSLCLSFIKLYQRRGTVTMVTTLTTIGHSSSLPSQSRTFFFSSICTQLYSILSFPLFCLFLFVIHRLSILAHFHSSSVSSLPLFTGFYSFYSDFQLHFNSFYFLFLIHYLLISTYSVFFNSSHFYSKIKRTH